MPQGVTVSIPVAPREVVFDKFAKGSYFTTTVFVRYSKQFEVRIWLARQLMRVIGTILGCKANLNIVDKAMGLHEIETGG